MHDRTEPSLRRLLAALFLICAVTSGAVILVTGGF